MKHFIVNQQSTLFLNTRGTFSSIDHILGHKSGLNFYKKIDITPCIFSDHKALKLEVNHKKNFGKTTNTCKLKNIILKNEWVNQETKGEMKKYIEANENENLTVQNLWDSVKLSIRGDRYRNIGPPQEARKVSNMQPNLTPKRARKGTVNKA